MKARFEGKRVASILGILPENEVYFEDEVSNYSFPEKQTLRLKQVMGYKKHRLSKSTTTVFDMASYGVRHLLEQNWIQREDVGAIIVVTLCPDHFVPHISNMLQGAFGFGKDVICVDIAQGCCGYIMGLFQAFMLLEHMCDRKVLLVNGDVLTHKVSNRDRNAFPIMGDGAAISIIENTKDGKPINIEINCDGSNADVIKIPAGGLRMPSSPDTSLQQDSGDGNFRSLDDFYMDGTEVFNFMQREVPPLIESLLSCSSSTMDEIDYFLFHQPNKFMLNKIAHKLGVSPDKMPMNLVENIGNTSGSTIPLTAVLNLKDELVKTKFRCCLAGFGSGLAWGGTILDLGEMDFCEEIISDL